MTQCLGACERLGAVMGQSVWCLRCTHGTPHDTHARARAHTHTHRAPVDTFFFLHGRALGLQACSSASEDALQGVALLQGCSRRNRTLLQACSVRAPVSLRGPFRGKSFELPRRKARGDGR